MKKQCTFDRLMTKYKQQKDDSQNQPLKKRESTLPKWEDDKIKQLAVVQPTAPSHRVVPRFLAGVPRFYLWLHRNGVLMEFGCRILRQHPCIANKGGEILLVQFQDPPSLADSTIVNRALAVQVKIV